MAEFDFIVTRDSTFPEGRARALKRMSAMLARFPAGLPDRANCFFHGLTFGWVISKVIGQADADEVEALLPPRPRDVMSSIPYGPDGISHPEFANLTFEELPDGLWFDFWMGLKKHLYFFEQRGSEMPERNVLAWLGFLRGELEAEAISEAEYDKVRSLLPPVRDDLTPLVVATA